MPKARAVEAVRRAASPFWAARAKDTPTAIPSGMLCRVTASTSSAVRLGLAPRWKDSGPKWGRRKSIPSRNPMPSSEPPAAGSQPV